MAMAKVMAMEKFRRHSESLVVDYSSSKEAFRNVVAGSKPVWKLAYGVGAAADGRAMRQNAAATMESWEEIAPSLPLEMRELARGFVELCGKCNAFYSDPACQVDVVEEGQVMFDWNNGRLPVFTVLITDEPLVVHVGRLADGKVRGSAPDLGRVGMPLRRFVQEIGKKTCQKTVASPDSSLRVTRASPEDSPPSTRLRVISDSQSSQLRGLLAATFPTQASM